MIDGGTVAEMPANAAAGDPAHRTKGWILMSDPQAIASTHATYPRSGAEWMALVVSFTLFLLGVRAFFDPVSASAAFGLPMHSGAETSFVQVYGARNAFLGAVALSLIVLRMSKPVALIFTLATVLPPLDAWVIVSRLGMSGELIRHAVILLVLVVASVLLWRQQREVAEWSN